MPLPSSARSVSLGVEAGDQRDVVDDLVGDADLARARLRRTVRAPGSRISSERAARRAACVSWSSTCTAIRGAPAARANALTTSTERCGRGFDEVERAAVEARAAWAMWSIAAAT